MTGNKQKECLCGIDQVLQCFYLLVYPEAEADKIGVFIFNQGGERHD